MRAMGDHLCTVCIILVTAGRVGEYTQWARLGWGRGHAGLGRWTDKTRFAIAHAELALPVITGVFFVPPARIGRAILFSPFRAFRLHFGLPIECGTHSPIATW